MKKLLLISAVLFSFNISAENCLGSPVKNQLLVKITEILWKDCRGNLTYSDGSKYIGSFKDGKPSGFGTLYYKNDLDQIVTGTFINGKINGNGTMSAKDDYFYIGQFKDGFRHGRGFSKYPDGSEYNETYSKGIRLTISKTKLQLATEATERARLKYEEELAKYNRRQNNARAAQALTNLGSALLSGRPPKVKHGRGSITNSLCPDGSYVSGDRCNLNPDGSYTSGSRSTLCPDGSYVSGSTCHLMPDGSYIGSN